jgi:hypothetical protein
MGRAKREELKRYHEARKSLTPGEKAVVDAREAAEKALDEDAEWMNRRLFRKR